MKKFSNVKLSKLTPGIEIENYQFDDQLANGGFLVAFFALFFLAYFVFRNYSLLPPEVPFFLTLNWGAARLAPAMYVWFVPGFLVLFFLVNYAFALLVHKQVLLLARMIGLVTCILALGCIYVVWNIVSLVIIPVI